MPTSRIEQPTDKNGNLIENLTPTATALARTVQALTSSFKIDLNASTTLIRVYAIAKDVYMKWSTGDEDYVTSSNFDEVIPAGQFIDLVVPNQTDGTRFDKIQLVGREAGSTVIVIEK